MAKQTISIGTIANDGTGDTLRVAFGKCNDNFTELYAGVSFANLASAGTLAVTGTSTLAGTTWGNSAAFAYGNSTASGNHRTALGLGTGDSPAFTRVNAATFGDVNGIAFTSGYGVIRIVGGGSSAVFFGSSDDTRLKRYAAGVWGFDNGVDNVFRDIKVRSVIEQPPASITPASNGDLVVEATSNTTLTFKLKGTDGTVRTGTITLA